MNSMAVIMDNYAKYVLAHSCLHILTLLLVPANSQSNTARRSPPKSSPARAPTSTSPSPTAAVPHHTINEHSPNLFYTPASLRSLRPWLGLIMNDYLSHSHIPVYFACTHASHPAPAAGQLGPNYNYYICLFSDGLLLHGEYICFVV
jgi:hypothetical protein